MGFDLKNDKYTIPTKSSNAFGCWVVCRLQLLFTQSMAKFIGSSCCILQFRRHSHYLDIGLKRFVLFSTPHFICKHVEKQALQLSVQVLNISCGRVMIECFVENIIDKTMWKQQFLGSNSSGNLFQMFYFSRFVFFEVFKSLLMQSDRT